MHVQVELLQRFADVGLGQGQRRLGRFLHHVTELTGQDQLARTRHLGGLDEQDVPAHRRPRQARRHARHFRSQRDLVLEPGRTQDRVQVGCIHDHGLRLFLRDFHRRRTQCRTDLAFEVAHTGLARVVADDCPNRFVGQSRLPGLEAVGLDLALHQVAPGDLELFLLRVAWQVNDLHAVAQRSGDRIELIRRGDEHHLRKVEIHGKVVVAELRVLLGIEHFEQRARRIAMEAARAEFVDLVQHQHARTRLRPADGLDDVARQGADVGAAVAADLRLIMRAAQRHALELASRGARN